MLGRKKEGGRNGRAHLPSSLLLLVAISPHSRSPFPLSQLHRDAKGQLILLAQSSTMQIADLWPAASFLAASFSLAVGRALSHFRSVRHLDAGYSGSSLLRLPSLDFASFVRWNGEDQIGGKAELLVLREEGELVLPPILSSSLSLADFFLSPRTTHHPLESTLSYPFPRSATSLSPSPSPPSIPSRVPSPSPPPDSAHPQPPSVSVSSTSPSSTKTDAFFAVSTPPSSLYSIPPASTSPSSVDPPATHPGGPSKTSRHSENGLEHDESTSGVSYLPAITEGTTTSLS